MHFIFCVDDMGMLPEFDKFEPNKNKSVGVENKKEKENPGKLVDDRERKEDNLVNLINNSEWPVNAALQAVKDGKGADVMRNLDKLYFIGGKNYRLSINSNDKKTFDSYVKKSIAIAVLNNGGYKHVINNWSKLKDLLDSDKDHILNTIKNNINNTSEITKEGCIDYLKSKISVIKMVDGYSRRFFNDEIISKFDDEIDDILLKLSESPNFTGNIPGSIKGSLGDKGNQPKQKVVLSDSKESVEKKKVSEKRIYKKAKQYGVTDERQIAYIFSTVKGECNFINQAEIGKGKGRSYGKIDYTTGQAYYGRGFVQLTHRSNYEKFTKIAREEVRKSGHIFEDNAGNVLNDEDLDLVRNPDIILNSNDLAAFILIYGMKHGTFTGKKLNDYINEDGKNFKEARRIINGMDRANQFAQNAETYLNSMDKYRDSMDIFRA